MTSFNFRGPPRIAQPAFRIPPGQHLVDSLPVRLAGLAPAIAQSNSNWNSKSAINFRVDRVGRNSTPCLRRKSLATLCAPHWSRSIRIIAPIQSTLARFH
jgi:hypothetical protein